MSAGQIGLVRPGAAGVAHRLAGAGCGTIVPRG